MNNGIISSSTFDPRSAFVPHDLEQAFKGSPTGPLAGFTAAVKDMTAAVIVLADSVRRWIGGRKQPQLTSEAALAEA